MSRSTKKAPAVAKHFLLAFGGNIKRLGLDKGDMALDDISCVDTSEDIRYKDLPRAIPEVVRRQIVALSKQQMEAQRKIEDILATLEDEAEQYLGDMEDAKEAELEASRVHCDKCGQVVPPKSKAKPHGR